MTDPIDLRALAEAAVLLQFVQIKAQTLSSDQSRAMAVAYLEARDVAQRLDDVVGPEGWSDSYVVVASASNSWTVECKLTILGVTKCDVGLGDDAKAAYSDAFKRAAVKFGLGRFLYTLPKIWGAYDNAKRRFADPAKVREEMLASLMPVGAKASVRSTVPPVPSAPANPPKVSRKTPPALTVVPEPDEIDGLDRVDLLARIDVEMELRGIEPAKEFVRNLGHRVRSACTDEQLGQLLRYLQGLPLTAAASKLPF